MTMIKTNNKMNNKILRMNKMNNQVPVMILIMTLTNTKNQKRNLDYNELISYKITNFCKKINC
jgi:hypothetical protein